MKDSSLESKGTLANDSNFETNRKEGGCSGK